MIHRDRQGADVVLAETDQPFGQVRRHVAGCHSFGPASDAVQRRPIGVEITLVRCTRSARPPSTPQLLKLAHLCRPAEALSSAAARHREDTPFSSSSAADRTEDRCQPTEAFPSRASAVAINMRDLAAVEGPVRCSRRERRRRLIVGLQDLHDDLRIELRGRGG